jgi:hypothetical protein
VPPKNQAEHSKQAAPGSFSGFLQVAEYGVTLVTPEQPGNNLHQRPT